MPPTQKKEVKQYHAAVYTQVAGAGYRFTAEKYFNAKTTTKEDIEKEVEAQYGTNAKVTIVEVYR